MGCRGQGDLGGKQRRTQKSRLNDNTALNSLMLEAVCIGKDVCNSEVNIQKFFFHCFVESPEKSCNHMSPKMCG